MHTWCLPVRVGYGSRASSRLANRISSEHFFNIRHFARETQGDDTIERVREAITFNAELADESAWLWLTSEQIGFPLRPTVGGEHEERAEDLDSSQGVRDHLVAYHLAPAITDFISDKNRVCCNNDLEQTLTLYTVNGVRKSSPRDKAQHIIYSLSAIQLTRKVQSSCVEACGGKRPRCQHLQMTLNSFVRRKRH